MKRDSSRRTALHAASASSGVAAMSSPPSLSSPSIPGIVSETSGAGAEVKLEVKAESSLHRTRPVRSS